MSKSGTVLRITVVAVTFMLFGHLLSRDYFVESLQVREHQVLARSSGTSFLGVYFKNERIGYVKNYFSVADDGAISLEQEALLQLNILGENHLVQMEGSALLSQTYLLQSFTFQIEAPFYTSNISGSVDGTDIKLTILTGKDEIHDVIHLKSPPFFATNRRAYLLHDDLTVGQKVKIPYFDPISLAGQDTIVEYKGREKILINGRVFNLHKFEEVFSGVRVKSWLNDKGEVVKEESPAGFVFLAEPEFKAKNIAEATSEILSAVSIPIEGQLTDVASLNGLRLGIELPEPEVFDLNGDRQSFDGAVLTISKEVFSEDAQLCTGKAEELAATAYVQAHHPMIGAVVSQTIVGESSGIAKVRKLADWVYSNIEKRPVLGIPDALSVLASRKGDCNEHAALFAALARNAGIPTRIAAGVVYHQGAFYYHAWNEICAGERWISLDTTKNQFPADVSHVKFIEGEIAEQVKIGALLGRLKIRLKE
nr:transglutaminase domain-containing protein [Desulfobulbaceae bacterium]